MGSDQAIWLIFWEWGINWGMGSDQAIWLIFNNNGLEMDSFPVLEGRFLPLNPASMAIQSLFSLPSFIEKMAGQ
jgi:hypothetical protein